MLDTLDGIKQIDVFWKVVCHDIALPGQVKGTMNEGMYTWGVPEFGVEQE